MTRFMDMVAGACCSTNRCGGRPGARDGLAQGEKLLVAGTATEASLETVSGLTDGYRALPIVS